MISPFLDTQSDVLVVQCEDEGLRLDKLLAVCYSQFSRTYFQWLIEQGAVLVNGARAKKRERLVVGDEIEVRFVLTDELSLEPEDIPLDILYEDSHMLAINKPPGMVVHPAAGNWNGTFVNALMFYCKTLPLHDTIRPGIVHRLDKDTSGVLIAAKTVAMHQALSALFHERKIRKSYLAICLGKAPCDILINAPIGRHPTQRKLMAVCPDGGREALTYVRLKKTNNALSLIEVDLQTGRTHQIRVHLKHIGHSILGDALYGNVQSNERYQASRQLLHCQSLAFLHPVTGSQLVIEAPIPFDMQTYLTMLG